MVVILLIGGGVSIITAYGHDWIFHVFVAEKYASVSYLLPWLTLSGGIFAAAQMLSIDRMSALDTKGLIAPKVVTAIAGGLLNLAGAYLYGIQGVVAASLIFSLVYFGWLLLQHLSHSPLPSET
jgi:O-antigen/teichoic acid export membrane protein